MYFTSDRPGGLGLDDLWFTTRASLDDPWGDPRNMSALNSSALDSLAVLSSDEHVMFFHSTRPGGCGAGDIWMTRRHNRRSEEWGPPINLGCVINTPATEIAPAFFENPETGQVTLFYGSNRPGGFGGGLRRLCKRCRRRRLLRPGSAGAGVQQRRARHAHFHKERWPGGVHHIGPRRADRALSTSGRQRGTRSPTCGRRPLIFQSRQQRLDDGSPGFHATGRRCISSQRVRSVMGRETSGTQPESKFAQENTVQPTLASFRNRMLAHLAGASH